MFISLNISNGANPLLFKCCVSLSESLGIWDYHTINSAGFFSVLKALTSVPENSSNMLEESNSRIGQLIAWFKTDITIGNSAYPLTPIDYTPESCSLS